MKKTFWLFKKLDFTLRVEIIVNISLLMLVAIILIGFTISKINERNVIEEKVRTGEGMIKDFQTMIDFISKDKKDLPLSNPNIIKEIKEFVDVYSKERYLHHLLILDRDSRVIASTRKELTGQSYTNDRMKHSILSGFIDTEVEKSGNLLSAQYKNLTLFGPLWFQGKIAGGIQMTIPIGDVTVHLLQSQRMILLSIILDGIVLIAFGSLLLSRVLVKPLKDLVQFTQKVTEGDFSQKIAVTSGNEIGQLISSFNRMLERLKENQENIENHVRSLEHTNKQLKQAREELIRTEKLASIGRFAAGVAHEVGNPLGAILGFTSVLQEQGLDPEESKDYLKRIEKEIERINRIVRELLDFARPTKFETSEVEMNKVVENTLSLFTFQQNFKTINTQLDLQEELPRIKGDESQLSQVLINIILNAVDAMPSGGTLGIQTREYVVENSFAEELRPRNPRRRKNDPVESDYSHLRQLNPLTVMLTKFQRGDRLVKVRISDTGIGIKKGDLERIFDPFFTTKSPDKGTGLGLSISLMIIESMSGEMRVESELGKGSTFEIYLPAA
jgi:two-component system, NtrC family, sensor kinase